MQSFDTYIGLKQIHLIWKVLCIAPWNKYKKCRYYWLSFLFGLNVLLISTVVLDFVHCEDFKCVLGHTIYYLGVVSKTIQYLVMFFMRKKLLQLENLFHILDDHVISPEDQVVANNAIQRGQRIIRYFLVLVAFAIYSRILGFLFTLGEIPIIPLETPFENIITIKFLYESMALHMLGLQGISIDMYPPLCFLLMNAHLKILSRQLLGEGTESNIASIVERHIIILKIYKILDETVSNIFTWQLLVASMQLCILTMSSTSESVELPEIMFNVAYTIAIMFEILPISMLVSQFQTTSEQFADAAYGTNWVDRDRSFRMAILFIIHRSQNTRLILAGSVVPINLKTFLNILRYAYSFSAIYSTVY